MKMERENVDLVTFNNQSFNRDCGPLCKEFGECQIPYTQKTSFVDLGKE